MAAVRLLALNFAHGAAPTMEHELPGVIFQVRYAPGAYLNAHAPEALVSMIQEHVRNAQCSCSSVHVKHAPGAWWT